MKFSAGCLFGALLGLLFAAGIFFGYQYFFSGLNLLLLPTAAAGEADLTLTVGELYLNDQLQREMVASGMKYSDVTIDLHAPNRAEASMSLNVTLLGQPLAVRPRGEFHFGVTNGAVTVDLESLNVNGLNVPQDLVDRQVANMKSFAEARVNADVKRALTNTGLHIVGVEATEDALIIKLSR